MRSKPFIIIASLLSGLLVAVGGVYAYDSSGADKIAKGVRVGGIDLGGLSSAQAHRRLEQRYLAALNKPITVHHDTTTWTLTAKQAKVGTNVPAMVASAVRRSEEGGMFGRSWRRATGGSLDVDLEPSVTYHDPAIVHVLDAVRKHVERKPVDATLKFVASGFERTRAKVGLKVKASRLHQQMRAAIVSTTASRRFIARTQHIKPKVTDKGLAKKNATLLLVDRGAFRLKLFKNLKLTKTYTIAVGAQGVETPTGLYRIQNKAENPAWSVPNSDWAGDLAGKVIPGGAPNNPLKSRWLGIFNGAGIHGVAPSQYGSLGSAASHGCVRMRIEDVEALYPQVPVGSPIYIA